MTKETTEYTPIASEQDLVELDAILTAEGGTDSDALTEWLNKTAQQAYQQSSVEWRLDQNPDTTD